jgi:hypothetical protein
MQWAEGVPVSGDDEIKRSGLGLLEMVRVYPGNADAWEALWLADVAAKELGEDERAELSSARAA